MIASAAGEIEDGALTNGALPYQPVASTAIYSMFSGFNHTGHTSEFHLLPSNWVAKMVAPPERAAGLEPVAARARAGAYVFAGCPVGFRRMERLGEVAKMPFNIHPHMLRHNSRRGPQPLREQVAYGHRLPFAAARYAASVQCLCDGSQHVAPACWITAGAAGAGVSRRLIRDFPANRICDAPICVRRSCARRSGVRRYVNAGGPTVMGTV
jgi:hypothetical protein